MTAALLAKSVQLHIDRVRANTFTLLIKLGGVHVQEILLESLGLSCPLGSKHFYSSYL